jgi:hypothetical protein
LIKFLLILFARLSPGIIDGISAKGYVAVLPVRHEHFHRYSDDLYSSRYTSTPFAWGLGGAPDEGFKGGPL